MKTNEVQHGGRRKGAGRKRLGRKPVVAIAATVLQRQRTHLFKQAKRHNVSMSAYLRRLIDADMTNGA